MYAFQPPLEISDFSGGITDDYVNCKQNQCQRCDNFLITINKNLLSRDGTSLLDSINPQIPAGNQRIGAFINHPSGQLFEQSARNLYYIASGTFQTLVGPVDSNPAFGANSTTNFISQAIWRNHVYLTSDSFCDPVKVFKDTSGTQRVRNAGLPSVDLEGALDLAVNIRSQYAAHLADTTEHTTAADTTNVIAAAAPTDLPTLVAFITEFITDYTAHELDSSLAAAWLYHAGQRTGSHALASFTVPTNLDDVLTFLDDVKTKFNLHDADTSAHGTDTLHQVTVTRTPTITSGGGAVSYIYGFFYKYTYTVGDITFENNGPVTYVQQGSLNASTRTISNLPAISNGSTRNYDTATITLEIYRTTDGGTVLYKLTSLPNGTASYTDGTADSTIDDNETIYTTGGVVDDDTPPPAKFISIVNDNACYAHIKTGSVVYPTRFGLTRPGSPDAYIADSEDDVEESITGVNNVGIYHILFTRNRVYRLEGFFDDLGRGAVDKREISREHGSISNRSIVKIPQGLVFAGADGFYFTDGYSVNAISKHLTDSFSSLVSTAAQESRIYGRYDAKNNLVYWSVSSLSTSTDNDTIYVLDVNYSSLGQQDGEGGVFTTFTGRNSWLAACLEYVSGTIVIGDARGYVMKFDHNALDDLLVDITVAASLWNRSAIIWDHKSFCTTFGTSTFYKFIPTITLQARNLGNVTPQIKSNNEDSNEFRPLKEIRIRDGLTWGEAGILWGSSGHPWNIAKLVRHMRRFPYGHLRTIYKQVQITNSKTIIYNSDTYGTGNSSGAANTLSGISGVFPADVVGYLLTLSNDTYTKEYTIITRGSDTSITVSDPDGDFSTLTGTQWEIKGYRKKERLNLLSYTLAYATVQENQQAYRGATGGNAT